MKVRYIAIAAAAAMTATPAVAKTYKIGFINTFSGGAAIYGKHQKDSLELALDHLGRKIGGLDVEVTARLQAAGATWRQLRAACFCNVLIQIGTRVQCFLVFIVSRLLYACEVWALPRAQEKRLERFYNARLRWMAGFSLLRMRVDHITDRDVRARLRLPPLRALLDRHVLPRGTPLGLQLLQLRGGEGGAFLGLHHRHYLSDFH